MARRPHHNVYVVLLSPRVLQEAKFRRCNPHYDATKPCVYVGMTGLDPDQRFDNHKAGIKAIAVNGAKEVKRCADLAQENEKIICCRG